MTKDEALKLALVALDCIYSPLHVREINKVGAAMTAIKEVLAQPEQKPVAYGMWDTMLGKGNRMMMVRLDKGQDGCTVPLYTTPPQREWVGLTEQEAAECWSTSTVRTWKAIEAKLKEKNT